MRTYSRLTPRGSRRQADLFFEDLLGEADQRTRRGAVAPALPPRLPVALPPPVRHVPAGDTEDFAEAVPLGGRGAFRHEPLGGVAGNNVEARWNVDAATAPGSTVEVVVYLHGYSTEPDDARFIAGKTASAGVDMLADDGSVRVRASRPTLALVPRGRHTRGATWVFDKLPDRAAFDRLVEAGLSWLASTALGLPAGSTPTRGRLTLAAHSGGGAGLSALLASGLDPDEVICFDSVYGGEDPIRRWALARIASVRAPRSGLRVFYTGCSAPAAAYPAGRWVTARNGRITYQSPGSWTYRNGGWHLITTEVYARRLHEAIRRALSGVTGGAALVNRFRVQRTSVAHNDIPRTYGALLLENIAADVARASDPPAATTRPVCVANDDWLTRPPRKPGGDDPPPARPRADATTGQALDAGRESAAEDTCAPPGARAGAPSANPSLVRTPPAPVTVAAATEWPQPTTDADGVSERALRRMGVCADGVQTLRADGMAALRPIAAAFGEPALVELFTRLRYQSRQLVSPPHSGVDLAKAFGRTVPRGAILAIRTLLVIPGHFRQLARRAGTEEEAYALENLGWLLMQSLGDEVRTTSGVGFWLPASPAFVTRFAAAARGLSPQVTQLIASRRLIDTAVDATAYRVRFTGWQSGGAGRTWRLETGRDTSPGRAAGAPFYREPFTIPPPVNITAERAEVLAAWRRRLADFDAGRTTVALDACDNAYLTRAGILSDISLRGVQLQPYFPAPSTRRPLSSLPGLAAVQPAFEGAFKAIADLGWNDLVFETQGMTCFRGTITAGDPAAVRTMSEHSMGTAVDFNVFENQQGTTGSMDPRIVALFEAFGFTWGARFTPPDPMHFEYAPGPART